MPSLDVNGTTLHVTDDGPRDAPALVLSHSLFFDHAMFDAQVEAFAGEYRVVRYDHRGQGASARAPREQLDMDTLTQDAAALIEALDLAPGHLVGSSYGGSISLGVAARYPDLVRSVVAHEPPLLGVASPGTALAEQVRPIVASIATVAADVRHGQVEAAATRFVEEIALGPGSWNLLPDDTRRTMVTNASTILDLVADPSWAAPPPFGAIVAPVLLTDGQASPTWFPGVVEALAADAVVSRHTFVGAGHVPHLTHAIEHVAVARSFIQPVAVTSGVHEGNPS
jgi:pimeloyl-ACP methyl ester carboxylesterase